MTTKDMVYMALFAALTAVLGVFPPIILPFIAVPITAQLMGPMLAGAIAGAKRGGLALLLFCFLVALGLPIMAGGKGGLSVFLGPSGGFVLAWPIAAYWIGFYFERLGTRFSWMAEASILMLFGVGIVYALGTPWLAWTTGLSLTEAMVGVLIFIPGDIVKVFLVIVMSRAVRKAYPLV